MEFVITVDSILVTLKIIFFSLGSIVFLFCFLLLKKIQTGINNLEQLKNIAAIGRFFLRKNK